ncbi:MAG: hypothetical protein LH609_15805 [Rudanella sp.]|nr:hypothetical protein [Rudanella sp.]
MGTNILEQRMLEDTLETFQADDYSSVTPAQGVMLIDGWLQALENDPHLESVQTALNQLRKQLNSPTPDRSEVKSLLALLADQAQEIAQGPSAEGQWTGGLQSMGVILREFSNQL